MRKGQRLHNIWYLMNYRCDNENYDRGNYREYHIQVCDEWRDNYEAFEIWALSHGYKEGLSLDRIDNHGNYCPENCRWVTQEEQCNNRTTNRYITWNGKTMSAAQWAEELGVEYNTLLRWINNMPLEKAMTNTPKYRQPNKGKKLQLNGEEHTIAEWAKLNNIKKDTLRRRINRGMNIEDALLYKSKRC